MEIREALLHRIGVLEDELTLIRQTLANALAQRSPAVSWTSSARQSAVRPEPQQTWVAGRPQGAAAGRR